MTTIRELAQQRNELEALKENMDAMLDAFKADPEWQTLQAARKQVEESIIYTEARVRMDAITAYNAEGIKKGEGVSIKMKTTAEIVDEQTTRAWCIDNFTPALKLDTKMIEKAAKDGTIPAELVKITTEPSAYIDSDLSKFLEG